MLIYNAHFYFHTQILKHTHTLCTLQHTFKALPFLSNTEVFLFPIVGILVLYVFNLVGYPFGLGWNASRIAAYIFFES